MTLWASHGLPGQTLGKFFLAKKEKGRMELALTQKEIRPGF